MSYLEKMSVHNFHHVLTKYEFVLGHILGRMGPAGRRVDKLVYREAVRIDRQAWAHTGRCTQKKQVALWTWWVRLGGENAVRANLQFSGLDDRTQPQAIEWASGFGSLLNQQCPPQEDRMPPQKKQPLPFRETMNSKALIMALSLHLKAPNSSLR